VQLGFTVLVTAAARPAAEQAFWSDRGLCGATNRLKQTDRPTDRALAAEAVVSVGWRCDCQLIAPLLRLLPTDSLIDWQYGMLKDD
jgi:cell division inhibitor SulA